MTKNESLQLKGIAKMKKLWYHLFDQSNYIGMYSDVTLGDNTFSYLLARCCNPVYIFLIISGYGLYVSYTNGSKLLDRSIKTLKLYIRYVFVITVFAVVAHFEGIDGFDSIQKYIENITLYNTSYVVVYWFLFPYIVIALCSKILFFIFDRYPVFSLLFSAFIYFGVSFAISRFGDIIWNTPLLDNFLHSIYLVFPFYIGAFWAKYNVLYRAKRCCNIFINSRLCFLTGGVIFSISIIRMLISSYAANIFYEPIFAFLFLLLPKTEKFQRILMFFGRYSTNLWFIHGWICYILLRDFIYSFNYPVFIFGVLIIISLSISIVLDFVFNRLKLL